MPSCMQIIYACSLDRAQTLSRVTGCFPPHWSVCEIASSVGVGSPQEPVPKGGLPSEPTVLVPVQFLEITQDGFLRHASLRLFA